MNAGIGRDALRWLGRLSGLGALVAAAQGGPGVPVAETPKGVSKGFGKSMGKATRALARRRVRNAMARESRRINRRAA